jgi:hypothetical protein
MHKYISRHMSIYVHIYMYICPPVPIGSQGPEYIYINYKYIYSHVHESINA